MIPTHSQRCQTRGQTHTFAHIHIYRHTDIQRTPQYNHIGIVFSNRRCSLWVLCWYGTAYTCSSNNETSGTRHNTNDVIVVVSPCFTSLVRAHIHIHTIEPLQFDFDFMNMYYVDFAVHLHRVCVCVVCWCMHMTKGACPRVHVASYALCTVVSWRFAACCCCLLLCIAILLPFVNFGEYGSHQQAGISTNTPIKDTLCVMRASATMCVICVHCECVFETHDGILSAIRMGQLFYGVCVCVCVCAACEANTHK